MITWINQPNILKFAGFSEIGILCTLYPCNFKWKNGMINQRDHMQAFPEGCQHAHYLPSPQFKHWYRGSQAYKDLTFQKTYHVHQELRLYIFNCKQLIGT